MFQVQSFRFMNRIFLVFVGLILSEATLTMKAQQPSGNKYLLTLEDVVQLAKEQSPMALQARHQFRASYFSFLDYKANFLPKLTLTTSPTSWDKSIRTVESEKNGVYQTSEVKTNTFTSTAGLALSQNIGFTGGNVSLGTDFKRRQNFLEENADRESQFTTNPIQFSISQPLNGYNQFRWLKQIEPLRYQEAKQRYIVQMENVSWRAVDYFFALAIAQVNLNQAKTNYKNQTALFEIANGRYEIGVLAEDQLLQVKLRYMQSESKLNNAGINIENSLSQLRTFLGFTDNVQIELITHSEVPGFNVPYEEALNMALSKNPDIIYYNRQILEAERQVAQAKSQTGITLSLDASFGMNKTGYTFNDAYSPKFDDREGISLNIKVPILDWNQTRNRYRNAQSNLEVIEAQMQQEETDFKQEIFLQVMKFNMQKDQLRIAAMADTIAQKSYDISYARYMTGRGDITVLNLADSEKDSAKAGYMSELKTYWSLYYIIRRLTLFDFQNNRELAEDFDRIID